MTTSLQRYADVYRKTGPWCTVYTDGSQLTARTLHPEEHRPRWMRETLSSEGAPPEDLDAVEEALLVPHEGIPDPVSQFILVRQGQIEVNEFLPGNGVTSEERTYAVIPVLGPLVRHKQEEFAYVVAEAGRDGGDIHLHFASRTKEAAVKEIEGDTDEIRKTHGGGWSDLKQQHRTENVWKKNAAEIAAAIDAVVRDNRAELLVVAGDVRARSLVEEQLAEQSRSILHMVETHTRAPGADKSALEEAVEELVADVVKQHQEEVLERLRMRQGEGSPLLATGLAEVVAGLEAAAVECLLVDDPGGWEDKQLLVLDGEPWVAVSEDQALGAEVLGQAPVEAALLRAAAMTDADVWFLPKDSMRGDEGIAALLRYPLPPGIVPETE
ncbi:MAG: hypothetical protein JWO29_86 [Arthrobacter sp.]|nr:hypothetical protein [Arthrobacter sp.]